jgi:hypothetical protein
MKSSSGSDQSKPDVYHLVDHGVAECASVERFVVFDFGPGDTIRRDPHGGSTRNSCSFDVLSREWVAELAGAAHRYNSRASVRYVEDLVISEGIVSNSGPGVSV